MWPLCVIGFCLCLDLLLGMGQVQESVFIQAFITEFSDEAFGKGSIRGLPRPYVFNDDSCHLCPLVKDGTGKLWTIINTNPFRISGDRADLIEKGYDLVSRNRGMNQDSR